jgi:3-hydroxypropanoate dehydrogenase
MSTALSNEVIDQLFLKARSQNGWANEPVSDEQIKRLYDLARQGPTAFNCSPARFVFIRTAQGKEKIKSALMPNNMGKALSAPVLAIVAYDKDWFEMIPKLFPMDLSSMFRDNEVLATTTAMRNGSLQGAYLMLAARALGLDCGPMSGFNNDELDKVFFPDGQWKSNFICGLGHGDTAALRPVGPRLDFDVACQLA